MKTTWTTPSGTVSALYADMLSQPHLLIAGATGSGKSVVINGIMATALYHSPARVGFYLIDPKRVELDAYRRLPHTVRYATEPADMVKALQAALALVEQRYREMQRQRVKLYNGADVYVIIDELADLMTTQKKAVLPPLQRLCQIGRAARVHVIAATQCPLASVIPTAVKVNFDSCLALHTRCAQDSRNIMQRTGAELLPRFGQGYYQTPKGCTLYNIPFTSEEEIHRLTSHWMSKGCCKRTLF